MALAALGALAAGADITPLLLAAAGALTLRLFWEPDAGIGALVERGSKVLAAVLFAWMLYVGLVVGGDILPPSLALLFLLLVGETLRPYDASNDFRLYSLSFAVLIAATAYYPGVGFGLAFAVYVVCATLALMVGHLRRQAERFRIADLRIPRSFLLATAVLSLITLSTSVVLFVAFPRLPRSWFGQGRAQSGSTVGFGDEVSLAEHGSRLRPNPEVMFRVEFQTPDATAPTDMYWRGLSFDRFDGTRWSRERDDREGSSFFPTFPYQARWPGELDEYRIFGGPPGVKVLFGQHAVVQVRPHSAIRPRFRMNGDIMYAGSDAAVYSVRSKRSLPSDALLRETPNRAPPDGMRYLQLPPLDPRVVRLADSLTAAYPTRIDRVRAVESWLGDEFRYTLDLPGSARETSLEHFLFERRAGHCEYFSTALAMLLRTAGIPARNVTGFMGGEWNDRGGYLAVTANHAHSWVEVWFPTLGWIPFDATPSADRDEMLVSASGSAVWPMLFWLDSVQFQWYRWVLAYDLQKQRDMLAALGERFAPEPGSSNRPAPLSWRQVVLWLLAGGFAGGALWLLAQPRSARHAEATRAYIELRRGYGRAGHSVDDADTPLEFVDLLRQAGAPAVEDAASVVAMYLRARFAGEELGSAELQGMADGLARVREALRRKRVA
jgi:transglutaminase-like putative cysteine protease